jgi:multidrug resistance efflux pump
MRFLVSIALIVLFISAGAVLGMFLLSTRVEPPRRDSILIPPLVESFVVQPEDISEQFLGYGSASPVRAASIASEVSAVVVDRVNDLRAGMNVDQDQVLIRLDNREFNHALDRANALIAADDAALAVLDAEAEKLRVQIKTAEQEVRVTSEELRRVARLYETEQAAKKEVDFASLAFEQARRVLQEYQGEYAKSGPQRARQEAARQANLADAALMKLNIDRCEIRAPFAGRVDSMHVEVGDHVRPGSPVLRLVDVSRVEVPIQLPAAAYTRVHVGSACRISCESMPGAIWRGEVARVAPTVNEQTRMFAAYVMVDNRSPESFGGGLTPGVFVTAAVEGPRHTRALLIPRAAYRQGRILVIEGDTVRGRQVTAMRFIEDRALVEGEIQAGDRVVLSHLDQLTDGAAVRFSANLQPARIESDKILMGDRSVAP